MQTLKEGEAAAEIRNDREYECFEYKRKEKEEEGEEE